MKNTIPRQTGRWIQAQLKLRGITQRAAAVLTSLSDATVSDFLRGRKDSPRVRRALCRLLGYADFDALIAAMKSEGRAA
jgi:transcriptional regulator with XRE-family HTH domain